MEEFEESNVSSSTGTSNSSEISDIDARIGRNVNALDADGDTLDETRAATRQVTITYLEMNDLARNLGVTGRNYMTRCRHLQSENVRIQRETDETNNELVTLRRIFRRQNKQNKVDVEQRTKEIEAMDANLKKYMTELQKERDKNWTNICQKVFKYIFGTRQPE